MTGSLDVAAIRARMEAAYEELHEVCVQGPQNRFRWSIPANPSRDTDLIIGASVADVPVLLGRVAELEAALERVRDAVVVAHAHRFDHEGTEEEAAARLWAVGVREPVKGGPDNFYNGVSFALRRVRAAIRDVSPTTTRGEQQ